MSILLNRESKVVVQGMTGSEGTFHTQQMIEFGTRVLGGVSPGKGGSQHLGLPVLHGGGGSPGDWRQRRSGLRPGTLRG